ncbi:MAG: RIP metalloprotease [Terricaulis sp.]|jgi:regulator of sigma E protease
MLDLLQNILTYLVPFVVVLSVVVFVHEFGHFQVARWRGVAIDTFSIGFGRTLIGWRDRQGVQWKIGALPLGGYVKFADDADAMSTAPRERIEDPQALAEARRAGLFHAQPLSTRSMVVAAGPVTNFIFAVLAFAAVAFAMGRDVTDYAAATPRIGSVIASMPAADAGLEAGEIVRAVDGVPLPGWGAFQERIAASPGQTLTLTLEGADGGVRTVAVTPRAMERPTAEGDTVRVGALGVQLGILDSERVVEPVGVVEALGAGAGNTWAIIARTGAYLGGIFSGQSSGRDIAGPLGILNASGQVTTIALDGAGPGLADQIASVALALLGWAAMLSVAVGFANLLPIPILDGGHLLFYAIEALRGGRPLPPVAQDWAFRAGLAVMASLFLFATWNDIARLFPGAQ